LRCGLGDARVRAWAVGVSRAQWRELRPLALRLAGMQGSDVVLAALQLHLQQRRRIGTRAPVPWTIDQAVAALTHRRGSATLWGVMRLLQAAQPGAGRIGSDAPFETDPVRLNQGLILGFTGLEVADVRPPGGTRRTEPMAPSVLTGAAPRSPSGDRPRRVTVVQNAVGLLGPNGPMPLVWTHYVRSLPNTRSVRARDSFLAFLNVLQRRQLTLLYRAWSDARPETAFDVVGEARVRHPVADRLRALAGLAHAGLDAADSVPHDFKLAFASAFARRVRSPVALQAMLAQFLGEPVRIEEFSARWLDIPTDQQSRLGWRFATLGADAVAGHRTWDCSTCFDVVIGPLSATRYRSLLPGTPGWTEVQDLVALYSGPEWSWRVRLTLQAGEVPAGRLGDAGCRLGWTSWLARHPTMGDAEDLAIASGPPFRAPGASADSAPPAVLVTADSEAAA
jgi:type VI secretion system protein ImpH